MINEEKINLLKQLGYSDQFIDSLKRSDDFESGLQQLESNSIGSLDLLSLIPVDTNGLVIEKTQTPQNFIINSTIL